MILAMISITTVLALIDLITAVAWNLLDSLRHDMHLNHGALQHMRGAGLAQLHPVDIAAAAAAAALRAVGTSRAHEEMDRRHGAVVTGIAVVRRFGIWESHGPVVSWRLLSL